MYGAFLSAFREGLQCSVALFLVLSTPGVAGRRGALALGVVLASLAGFSISYIPGLAAVASANEKWAFARHVFELGVLYLGVALLAGPVRDGVRVPGPVLFVAGFLLFFFDARALGFLVHDTGLMLERVPGAVAFAMLGAALGFLPLAFAGRLLKRLPVHKALTLPSLLVALGALRVAFGGVGELGDQGVMVSLQRGLQYFLEKAVAHMQGELMITAHPFMDVPLTGLANFLSSDRAALALVVALVMAPPVLVLVSIASRPDPELRGLEVAAQRRLQVAFFRKEIVYLAVPVLLSFTLIFAALHSANVSLNPLSEPVPMPIREADEEPGLLRIPLADRLGDFTDGKLRKYVYYYGSKQIMFLAILKPDGTAGVALDECEICKPAEWNKAAQGYAQRGEHLVCKYCMTPIPLPSLNKPGGCNPIPLPYKMGENSIIVSMDDLVRVYKSARELQKKGTHL